MSRSADESTLRNSNDGRTVLQSSGMGSMGRGTPNPHWMDELRGEDNAAASELPLLEPNPAAPSIEHFETDLVLEYEAEPARHPQDLQTVKLPAIARRGPCLPLGLTSPKIPDFFYSAAQPGLVRTFALSKYSKNLPKAFAHFHPSGRKSDG